MVNTGQKQLQCDYLVAPFYWGEQLWLSFVVACRHSGSFPPTHLPLEIFDNVLEEKL